MLYLTLRRQPDVPLELDGITPDRLVGLGEDDIARLPVAHGNRSEPLGEFFTVAGSADYGEMLVRGDCSRVKLIGARLTAGRICVEGDVGMHAGAGMTGGELFVRGHAGDWLGAEMAGGVIRVEGSAGDHVGAGYVGSRRGMTGGTIVVTGDVGAEAGVRMRRGLIAVGGEAGPFAAAAMIAGTLVVGNKLGRGAGAGMKRGTILTADPEPEIGPGFRFSCDIRPAFLGLLADHLHRLHFTAPVGGSVRCYRGDLLAGGNGELLVAHHVG
ncbi:MAG: formylmethanofuran dehydrogenase subunit C [Gemmataceae bacterium]